MRAISLSKPCKIIFLICTKHQNFSQTTGEYKTRLLFPEIYEHQLELQDPNAREDVNFTLSIKKPFPEKATISLYATLSFRNSPCRRGLNNQGLDFTQSDL